MTTAHAIAFCAGPLIVALLLAISGAFTQSAKTAARPPHAHVAFTSRFGARLSGNAHSLLLVCLMAALAECWNSVVTPDLGSVLGVDLQGTLLNLSGAALGGFAAVLAAHGGRRGALWSAFNDGFVAAYTSFVFFVVHAAELAARGAGDPSTSVREGGASRSPVRRRVGSLEPRPGEARQGDRGPVDAVPPRLPPPRPRVPPPRAPRGARRLPAAGGAAARRRRGPRGAARGAPGRGARARVRRGPGPRRRARLRLRRDGARVRRRRARRPPRRLRAVLRRPRPARRSLARARARARAPRRSTRARSTGARLSRTRSRSRSRRRSSSSSGSRPTRPSRRAAARPATGSTPRSTASRAPSAARSRASAPTPRTSPRRSGSTTRTARSRTSPSTPSSPSPSRASCSRSSTARSGRRWRLLARRGGGVLVRSRAFGAGLSGRVLSTCRRSPRRPLWRRACRSGARGSARR